MGLVTLQDISPPYAKTNGAARAGDLNLALLCSLDQNFSSEITANLRILTSLHHLQLIYIRG
jgi:hypothetical protein